MSTQPTDNNKRRSPTRPPVMTKDEAIEQLTDFLNERSMWTAFVEHLKDKGYSEEEFDKMLES